MPRKEKETLQSLLKGLKDACNEAASPKATVEIPSILEFCDSPKFLGLPFQDPPIRLFPMQRLVLKAFYWGTEGNTGPDSEITSEEIVMLIDKGLNTAERGDMVTKIKSGATFRELVLVWGRRSGKDFISSIIALYEAMKLLETPGGDPYAKYKLQRGGNPITVLTIANSASQAGIAFAEMKAKLMKARYFRDKFIPEGLTGSSIYLQTPADRRDDVDNAKRGLPRERGSIMIRAGHSNSDSLLGIQCFVLLLDEVASFKSTDGASGGNRIYEAMLPSLNTFVRDEIKIDPVTGVETIEKVFDSKVISISSPRGKDGILYKMFKEADIVPERLVCRLPTWEVNIKYTKDSLRRSFSQFNDERFMMEFGADFSGTAGSNFFDEARVVNCFTRIPKPHFQTGGVPGIVYYAHLDPSTTNCNYAFAICHKEIYVHPESNKADYFVILDHLKTWTPTKDKPIIVDEIAKHMLEMNLRFHIGLTTYDQFNSPTTLAMLQKVGMPCKMTHFNKQHKMLIYDNLEMLVNEDKLVLPFDENLKNEMTNLQRKHPTGGGRGYSVSYNKDCETPTDDSCDALAGAAYSAMSTQGSRLPQCRLVSMPLTQQGGQHQFKSMQGMPYPQRSLDHMMGGNTRGGIISQVRPGW